MLKIDRQTLRYTPYFCEENIWWLVQTLAQRGLALQQPEVWFFSNPAMCNVVFHQRAGTSGKPVCWDYHVVLKVDHAGQAWVFDFDTDLAFPTPAADYLRATFPNQDELHGSLRTQVRCVPAAAYLDRFSSDRSHMIGRLPEEAFPPYPPIQPGAGIEPIPLSAYWDMQRTLADDSRVTTPDALVAASSPA